MHSILDIDRFIEDDKVFVKNRTKTDFNMHISDNQGRITLIIVPRTFIPIDLTLWATIDQLKGCQELRAALRGQVLELVDPKEAKGIINTPEGKKELERIMNKLNVVSDDLLASDESSSALGVAAVGEMDDVNDQVRDALISEDMNPDEKLAIIVALDKEGSLERRDFEWIKSTATNSCPDVIDYADKRLKEMTGLLSR